MADDDVESTGTPPASPLPRRMCILAAICLAIAVAAIAGIFVTGARLDWDMAARAGRDADRGGPNTLGQLIVFACAAAAIFTAAAVGFARQAVLLTPERRS